MVLLIDTNVILDFLLKREPFFSSSKKIMHYCLNRDVTGYIALHTVTTIWYTLRKIPEHQRRIYLSSLCSFFEVVGTSHEMIVEAINNDKFKDFEDCVLTKCALSAGAELIITRNVKDFTYSEIPVLSPDDFIDKYI
jgi:predicted nucleic acid-binding protein